jgi:tryptophanyl-tRNA synthetase
MSDIEQTYTGPERVFSGVQPSGNLTLGNYLGAIKRFVEMQDRHDCIYCVVDMHAITVWQEPEDLRRATREVAAAYMAAGVDPKRSILFNQSIQGKIRKAQRTRVSGALCLSCADGGGYSCL